jgi:hypothetical protein
MRPHSDLSPVELEKLLEWRNYYADKLAKTSSYSGIRGTFASLVSSPYSESLNQQNTSFVQRPPGLPLSNGYLLHPIPITADNQRMLSSITEGEIVTISSSIRHRFPSSVITTPIAGSSAATIININRQLLQYGFAATGLDSIGLIGFPRAGSGIGVQKIASFFENGLMSPLESFGHTSVFVRQGGRITIVRGFQPTSWQTLSNISEIFSKRPVPSSITNDLASFTRTTAQTVEWPVTAGSAEKMAMHLSTLEPTPAAGATHWVAHPTAQNASATNCVKWSTTTVESQLGGRIGTVGADGLVDPISQPAYEGQGLQGRFMQATADGAETIAPLPGATADSAKGSMPRIYRILKWGGRAFVVVGILVAIGESVTAPEGQRARTAAREGGGFVGGLALGATAGLLCGPGALACSIVLGIGFGIAGHLLGRAVGEAIYDATK